MLGYAMIFSAMCLMSLRLYFADSGIDFTDESYYFILIKNPYLYKKTNSLFGFIFHNFYTFFEENIHILRVLNIFLINSFYIAMVYSVLSVVKSKTSMSSNSLFIFSVSIGSLFPYFIFVSVSPSYITLQMVSIAMTTTGVFLLQRRHVNWHFCVLLCASGLYLSFMSKPTSFSVLLFVVAFFIYFNCRKRIKYIATIFVILSLFLAMTILSIYESFSVFFYDMKEAFLLQLLLDNGKKVNSIFRLDLPELKIDIFFIIILTMISIYYIFKKFKANFNKFIYCFSIISVVIGIFLSLNLFNFPQLYYNSLSVIFSVCFYSCCCIILLLFVYFTLNKLYFHRKLLFSVIFLLSMPYVFAFSSGNNYFFLGVQLGAFWLLAILFIAMILFNRKFNTYVHVPACCILLLFQVISVKCEVDRSNTPHRQDASLYSDLVKTDFNKTKIYLSKAFAEYINSAVLQSQKANFTTGTPIIDLSGQSPGIIYALGGRSLGRAWLIGGYPGSDNFATRALQSEDIDVVKSSWLLCEPNGPRQISPTILSHFGLDYAKDYEIVARWHTAPGAGGYAHSREQLLLKPK